MQAKGKVFKYGDNVDTDVIIPARYLAISDPKELAEHCMEDIDKEFVHKVKPGDIMVANKNFGCGSSREHAPLVIKVSRQRIFRTKMRWKWILTAESFTTGRPESSIRDRRFRNSCRRLSRRKA